MKYVIGAVLLLPLAAGADVEETVVFPMPAYPASVQASDAYDGVDVT
ncbi:hypothetical protein GPY61_24910 [Massilia sp. NEAU-DD11]|uniref:Uncharacterized protein n=1 Tax=Massilia cellulosiltytica TaxID=2683234 RepID=A0A7X3KAL6_9BURK|nr:hypothetical protein [Telluria cellulosilytica]MVW63166.1 hypothetical protein [Telluria cellulosilytica]